MLRYTAEYGTMRRLRRKSSRASVAVVVPAKMRTVADSRGGNRKRKCSILDPSAASIDGTVISSTKPDIPIPTCPVSVAYRDTPVTKPVMPLVPTSHTLNHTDPIMFEPIGQLSFTFSRYNPMNMVTTNVLFNLDTLIDYFLSSGQFVDPVTRVAFTEDDTDLRTLILLYLLFNHFCLFDSFA